MSEWKEYRLKEFATIQTGPFGSQLHMSDYKSVGTPIITVEHLGENKIIHQNLPLVSNQDKERLNRYLLQEGDIVFSRVGSVDRRAIVSKEEDGWMFSGRCLRVRINNANFSARYISYFFGQESFKEHIRMIAVGATMPSINTEILSNVTLLLPPLPQQQAIAGILSSLDDKIDLLHRQNKTLEALAETLFRQWFIEETEGKELVELGNYIESVNGVSYKSTELNPSKVALVTLKSFERSGGFRIDGFKDFTGRFKEKQVVEEGDLIVAHTDITQDAEIIGNPALVISDPNYEVLVISMDLVKVVSKLDWISNEFLYYLMKSREFKGHCEGNANGSTVLHLNKQAILTFNFPKPEYDKVQEFSKIAKTTTQKFFVNYKQIRQLTQLRDNLLPKLMSGAVTVGE